MTSRIEKFKRLMKWADEDREAACESADAGDHETAKSLFYCAETHERTARALYAA